MQDDVLKDLFNSYRPELTSEDSFMKCLQYKLDAVELIRDKMASQRRKDIRATWIAAICGLIVGILLTLVYPFMLKLSALICSALSLMGGASNIVGNILCCIFIGAVSFASFFAVYDLLHSSLPKKVITCREAIRD